MPGIQGRMMHQGHPPDHATVGECRREKYCSPRLFAAPRTYGLSDTCLTFTQNPHRCPSEKISGMRGKTGVYFLPAYYNPIPLEIVPVISAICFRGFTSVKLGENVNYARFFANYARNPNPDHAAGTRSGSCHRRRVPAGKVLLSPRLFAAPCLGCQTPPHSRSCRTLDPDMVKTRVFPQFCSPIYPAGRSLVETGLNRPVLNRANPPSRAKGAIIAIIGETASENPKNRPVRF